jgi:hypothetical protein
MTTHNVRIRNVNRPWWVLCDSSFAASEKRMRGSTVRKKMCNGSFIVCLNIPLKTSGSFRILASSSHRTSVIPHLNRLDGINCAFSSHGSNLDSNSSQFYFQFHIHSLMMMFIFRRYKSSTANVYTVLLKRFEFVLNFIKYQPYFNLRLELC